MLIRGRVLIGVIIGLLLGACVGAGLIAPIVYPPNYLSNILQNKGLLFDCDENELYHGNELNHYHQTNNKN